LNDRAVLSPASTLASKLKWTKVGDFLSTSTPVWTSH